MKNNTKFIYLCSIMLLLYTTASAQFILKEANQEFNRYNFAAAVKLYTEAYQLKKTTLAAARLAESYRMMRNYKQAEKWYAILQNAKGVKPEQVKWYAEMLKTNAKYNEAKVMYQNYQNLLAKATPEQLAAIEMWKVSCDSAVSWMKNPKPISVTNEAALNSPQADFDAVEYQNTIVFTSDRPEAKPQEIKIDKPFLKIYNTKTPSKVGYGWTGNPYLKIYQTSAVPNEIAVLNFKAKGNYHIGKAAFNTLGDEAFFTITQLPNKLERVKKAPSTINIEIFNAKKINGVWQQAVPFRYNKVQKWSVADPFLTADGQTLYFVSNMPGGKGGTDIYYCNRNTDLTWGDAINLAAVNTAGNERSVSVDNRYIYFSSDGRVGMGGLDIYRARKRGEGVAKIENLGYPINSPQDDFSFSLASAYKKFISSNREGGVGDDDIYSYVDSDKIPFQSQIFDKDTRRPVANAQITLTSLNGQPITIETDENGRYQLGLEENTAYSVQVDKSSYETNTTDFSTKGLDIDSVFKLDFPLKRQVLAFKQIYYDFDKANIRADAAKELDKLIKMLKSSPSTFIELDAHTDVQGTNAYNQRLSDMRALAALRYILGKGVDKSRIVAAKGYGEEKPVVPCLKCTIPQNKLNRRTEFKVVKQ